MTSRELGGQNLGAIFQESSLGLGINLFETGRDRPYGRGTDAREGGEVGRRDSRDPHNRIPASRNGQNPMEKSSYTVIVMQRYARTREGKGWGFTNLHSPVTS